MRLRLAEKDRDRADILDVLRIPRPGGRPVELSNVASIVPAPRAVAHRPPRPQAHGRRARRMSRRASRSATGIDVLRRIRRRSSNMPAAYTTRATRTHPRDGAHVQGVHLGLRDLGRVHVPDHRVAVREPHPPGHDPARRCRSRSRSRCSRSTSAAARSTSSPRSASSSSSAS